MIHRRIADCYCAKSIIHACFLRSRHKNISWEIADFNRDNPKATFDIKILNEVESIVQHQTNFLKIDYETLLQLLLIQIDRNEIERASI